MYIKGVLGEIWCKVTFNQLKTGQNRFNDFF